MIPRNKITYILLNNNIEPTKGAACTGESVRSEECGDIADSECAECFDKYDKCEKIPTSFCTDVRYAAVLERTSSNYLV